MNIAIIGGGPIGMEAALYGACAGFDVRLYERGRLAENVRQWGHIQVFTNWGRNRSPLAVKLLQERGGTLPDGGSLPDGDTTSSGDELADYVVKLAALEPLRGRISPQTEVAHVSRERCLKSDWIPRPGETESPRRQFPFRLHLRGVFGERTRQADVVIDATGVWATPNWIGSGGAPCPGEERWAKHIDYHLPDVTGADLRRFANRHTLIAGSGHSAASTLRSIGELFAQYPQTRVTWIVRRDVPQHGYPYTLIPDDPSPHRAALHERANELAEHPNVRFLPRTVVESLEYNGRGFGVHLANDGTVERIDCDNVVAHTGFRPDKSLWQELQVDVHPAIDGPRRLADQLIEQNRRAGVGLSTGYAEKRSRSETNPSGAVGEAPLAEGEAPLADGTETAPIVDRWRFVQNDPQILLSGEPDFYVIGIKSYGRDAGFLMQNGFRQVRDIYKIISGNPHLDLYDGELD